MGEIKLNETQMRQKITSLKEKLSSLEGNFNSPNVEERSFAARHYQQQYEEVKSQMAGKLKQLIERDNDGIEKAIESIKAIDRAMSVK